MVRIIGVAPGSPAARRPRVGVGGAGRVRAAGDAGHHRHRRRGLQPRDLPARSGDRLGRPRRAGHHLRQPDRRHRHQPVGPRWLRHRHRPVHRLHGHPRPDERHPGHLHRHIHVHRADRHVPSARHRIQRARPQPGGEPLMIVSLEPELLERLSRLDGGANAAVAEELDADLAAAVRRTAVMRRLFYAAVLAVALYGTATGAVAQFGLPWWVAIGGIFALELGGVVFLSNAEVRRRLGEHASLSRLLGAAVAGAAATFNVLTHRNLLLGGFFALMSVLGFLAWWLDVENKRRDRLRARGQLAAATPSYELWGHWLRHPVVTRRARGFAKAYPQLGLY